MFCAAFSISGRGAGQFDQAAVAGSRITYTPVAVSYKVDRHVTRTLGCYNLYTVSINAVYGSFSTLNNTEKDRVCHYLFIHRISECGDGPDPSDARKG